mgnify:CR=1 FL=1
MVKLFLAVTLLYLDLTVMNHTIDLASLERPDLVPSGNFILYENVIQSSNLNDSCFIPFSSGPEALNEGI